MQPWNSRGGIRGLPDASHTTFRASSCRRCLSSVRGRRDGRHLMVSDKDRPANLIDARSAAAPLRVMRPDLIPGFGEALLASLGSAFIRRTRQSGVARNGPAVTQIT